MLVTLLLLDIDLIVLSFPPSNSSNDDDTNGICNLCDK